LDPQSFQTASRSNLDALRSLVRFAHAERIDLRLVWSPVHARTLALYRVSGMLDANNELKQQVVRIVEESARSFSASPFPIWDGGRLSIPTLEPVPLSGDLSRMHFFSEGSHFTPVFGRAILDAILRDGSPGSDAAPPLVVRLTSENMLTLIEQTNAAIDQWMTAHSDEVARLESVYLAAERTVRTGK
jgi:hypothetical protein